MTTEEAFQAALDAEPDNHTLREIFADWLEEQGDERADGYRALGVNGLTACDRYSHLENGKWVVDKWIPKSPAYLWKSKSRVFSRPWNDLPSDWFDLIDSGNRVVNAQIEHRIWPGGRRDGENAAALAFAKLPESRRAELLRQPSAVET